MNNVAPLTFGAGLAACRSAKEETAWFFNLPAAVLSETTPAQVAPADADEKIQIGPLDV
ncbi:hypothetical protein [Achromobacter sp.]|uniref:hypothetical protein n=1 Tax=Achromobacter TaxID=222 RepID=UPI00257A381A